MNFKEFNYRVEAEVEFTLQELIQLSELARNHYDCKCKAAADRGGLLYGMSVMLFGHPVGDITVTNNDIDLLRKIAEAENGYAQLGGVPYLGEIGKKLADIQRKMTEEWRRINNIETWMPA